MEGRDLRGSIRVVVSALRFLSIAASSDPSLPAEPSPYELAKRDVVERSRRSPGPAVAGGEFERFAELAGPEAVAPFPRRDRQFAFRRADERLVPVKQANQPVTYGQNV